jgi:hypothetical protein
MKRFLFENNKKKFKIIILNIYKENSILIFYYFFINRWFNLKKIIVRCNSYFFLIGWYPI